MTKHFFDFSDRSGFVRVGFSTYTHVCSCARVLGTDNTTDIRLYARIVTLVILPTPGLEVLPIPFTTDAYYIIKPYSYETP